MWASDWSNAVSVEGDGRRNSISSNIEDGRAKSVLLRIFISLDSFTLGNWYFFSFNVHSDTFEFIRWRLEEWKRDSPISTISKWLKLSYTHLHQYQLGVALLIHQRRVISLLSSRFRLTAVHYAVFVRMPLSPRRSTISIKIILLKLYIYFTNNNYDDQHEKNRLEL